MDFAYVVLAFAAYFFYVSANYNKDVTCIIDKGGKTVCKTSPKVLRRSDGDVKSKVLPSYDPYIPQKFELFYNCTKLKCEQLYLNSLTQVTDPDVILKGCYKLNDKFACDNIRYNHLKNVDKILFLNSNVKDKTFYVVDCLVYNDGGRVCHRKDDLDSHVKLVDTGTIVRPNETYILSQDEFICEENNEGHVNCDINPFVSYDEKLVLKESLLTNAKVLLKTGNYVVQLQKNCIWTWCGYSGIIIKSTRRDLPRYEPPGGKIFRCYYAKKQQICKRIPSRPGLIGDGIDSFNFQAG
ncbi:uncharacterized protein LOC128678740 isoform X2 [Plodia interpunctella]|uniref:uncharacterized protein LOC128678740 isoform X2 n=1 Tax=Plodia interpunctella TaxID=58824 RepID=UPI0023687A53|nr:uncharacterized protein LOC128678740 isoform X2 [Plodia interpunctella]